MREHAPVHGKRLLRAVWGVRKQGNALVLPEHTDQDNPLLAAMWAHFQMGCRLLYASGACPCFFCHVFPVPYYAACCPVVSC